mmetsp:Transcript_55021/g.178849  ORF Transcript_55021/g.178849 Transcript_55021/m.178849 type:complete len:135 (-) Transcript_55021:1060-1464(-)
MWSLPEIAEDVHRLGLLADRSHQIRHGLREPHTQGEQPHKKNSCIDGEFSRTARKVVEAAHLPRDHQRKEENDGHSFHEIINGRKKMMGTPRADDMMATMWMKKGKHKPTADENKTVPARISAFGHLFIGLSAG